MRKRMRALGLILAAGLFLQMPVQAAPAADQAEDSPGTEGFSRLLEYVKEKWDAGQLESEADIQAALEEGDREYGLGLDENTKEELASLFGQVNDLGLDHDLVVQEAARLYEVYGEELTQHAAEIVREELAGPLGDAVKEQVMEPVKEAAKETVKAVLHTFWVELRDSVASFFKSLFHI